FGAVVLALGVPGAMAVHDLGFQLDGDIAQGTSAACHSPSLSTCPPPATIAPAGIDWSSLFAQGTTTDAAGTTGTPGGVPSPALPDASLPGWEKSTFVKDFVSGATGPDNSTFSTGSKDVQAIDGGGLAQSGSWTCTPSPNVGDKVDLVNA